MSTWYLGPLGDLRPLVAPERDISINEVRYGGIHQGLTGARTMDVTGHRSEYAFEFKWIDADEWRWYEALHTRVVSGPFHLINPLKRNRLSLQATALRVSSVDRSGVRLPVGATHSVSSAFPGSIGLPVRSLFVSAWSGATASLTFDPGKFIPVRAGEAVSASVYLGCAQATTHAGATLKLDWFNSARTLLAPTTSASFTITPTWTRQTLLNVTPPAGAVACRLSVGLTAANTQVFLAAPQVEVGAVATPFEPGGAAPEVLIDQLSTTSPRFPLRNATLTVLEA